MMKIAVVGVGGLGGYIGGRLAHRGQDVTFLARGERLAAPVSHPRLPPGTARRAPAASMSAGAPAASTRVQTELAGSITSAAYRPCCWWELGPKWSWVKIVRRVLFRPFWLMIGSAHHS